MTALAAEKSMTAVPTAASRLVERNWTANIVSLAVSQPHLLSVAGELPSDFEWVVARDGSVTALTVDGSWWAGCSVPRLAAKALLKTLERSPLVSAYLSPANAELIHAARERMGPEPAMIAIVPEVETFRMLLATGDFAADIKGHRLWFVVGQEWADELQQLLLQYPGLPPAGRFIRTKLTDGSITEPMIAAAQHVFSLIATQRTVELAALSRRPVREGRELERVLLIAPSRYRLWDCGSDAIDEIENEIVRGGRDVLRFDSDDPISASPLSLALAAQECDAIIAANVFRADAASLVATEKPWITWCTRLPIPAVECDVDRIIVADQSLASAALAAGWTNAAVKRGAPAKRPRSCVSTIPQHLAILADLSTVTIPSMIEDLSSHRLLWEQIESEIHDDPFVVGDDPVGYLMHLGGQIGITVDEIDVRSFVDGLITPLWQREIVSRLAASGIPMAIYGHGWAQETLLTKHARGPIGDHAAFEDARDRSTALLHVWPGVANHPISLSGHRVVHNTKSWKGLLNAVRAALQSNGRLDAVRTILPLTAVRELLASPTS